MRRWLAQAVAAQFAGTLEEEMINPASENSASENKRGHLPCPNCEDKGSLMKIGDTE